MLANLNPIPVSSAAGKAAQMAAYFNGSGDGATLICNPYSNVVAPDNNTVIGDFTPGTYTGALAQTANPGVPYFDLASQQWRVSAGTLTFQGTNGVKQAMSFKIAGAVTMAGTLITTVTAAGETGSPRAVTSTVALSNSPTAIAAIIASDLNADADTGGFFVASSSGPNVILTAKTAAANDGTMNAALTEGTATGITPVPTATVVAAGVAPGSFTTGNISGVYCTDLAGNYQGAFPFGATYAIEAVGQGVTLDIDIPYGW